MSLRVMLADDHQIVRDGLRRLLDDRGAMVVAEASDGREAVKLAKEHEPGLIVMDVAMPSLNGVEATRQILKETPRVKVIALSMHAERPFVSRMLEAGATGYLLKECAFDELNAAIDTVLEGSVYLSKGIAGVVVSDYVARLQGAGKPTGSAKALTPKEREVLQLLAEGKSSKEMAAVLHVSVKTIETHRQNIMDKLGIRTIAELTKYAVREGLTSLE
ncbi:MAG: response regulator transcription factor [Planctomycetota bacterium]